MERRWKIEINRHRGFAPKFYEESYPSYGNKEQAGAMQNMSLLDPKTIQPGPLMSELTAGDETGAVTTLIRSILNTAVTSNATYAVGSNQLHQLSATAVTNAGSFPHTIDKGTVTGEDGEDVAYYQGKLYYSYNHSGSGGDVGQYDLSSTFDDDYYSTTPTGSATLQNAPHQMIVGGDDVLYIANGRFIAYLDGTTANDQALDFWQNSVISSISWNYNRVLAAVNRPNLTGVNVNQSAVYRWNGFSDSWEGDPVEVNGRIGALYTKNGITYIWYETFSQGTSIVNFGFVNGGSISVLRTHNGTLPLYYQVGEMYDYIIWISGQRVYAYGPVSGETPVDFFQIMSPQYATSGGIASPFGKVLAASTNGTGSASLEVESTSFATDASYKTLLFDVGNDSLEAVMDKLELATNALTSGNSVTLSLVNNKGATLWSDTMSFAGDGGITKKIFFPRARTENARLEYSPTGVAIRSVILSGRTINYG